MIRVLCRWAAWPLLAVIVFVTLSPIGWRPVTGGSAGLERLAAFAALGGMFSLGYPKHRVLLLLFLVVIAGALESLQNLMPTRHSRIPHAAAKALGPGMGFFVAGRRG